MRTAFLWLKSLFAYLWRTVVSTFEKKRSISIDLNNDGDVDVTLTVHSHENECENDTQVETNNKEE